MNENHSLPRGALDDCADMAPTVDPISAQLAKEAVEDNILVRQVLCSAFKAQSQSRATLDSVVSFATPRVQSMRSERNFDEQTGANGNHPSP